MFFLSCKSRCFNLLGLTLHDMRNSLSKCCMNRSQQRLLSISCQVEHVQTRGLIRVSGEDASSFLQGIVTNDMRHLQECKSLYTMFLNTKGRVLYDSIIYKRDLENTFFVECDHNGLQDLVKHFKMYRVRRKVDIASVEDEYKVWALFNPREVDTNNNSSTSVKQDQVVPCSPPNLKNKKDYNIFNDLILGNDTDVFLDPRLYYLGYRVIAPDGEDVTKRVESVGVLIDSSSTFSYRMFRYRLGVGEGVEELPVGKCFPLEANCDYLHGVSFHKGCYIGQELTARTHHTGVVRKRLMPLLLEKEISQGDFPVDSPIEATSGEKKTAIGKLRGVEKNSALGLLRIVEALEEGKLKIGCTEGTTVRPFWWPQELPKERVDTSGGGKKG